MFFYVFIIIGLSLVKKSCINNVNLCFMYTVHYRIFMNRETILPKLLIYIF